MPRSPAILEKNEFFIIRAVFPWKASFQPQSYDINLGKVYSFIIEQVRIIEFCPLNINTLINNTVFNLNIAGGTGVKEAVFTTCIAWGKAVRGLSENAAQVSM